MHVRLFRWYQEREEVEFPNVILFVFQPHTHAKKKQ